MSKEEAKQFIEAAKKVRLACWESKCDDCPFKVNDELCMFEGSLPSDWTLDDEEEEDE